MSVPQVGEWLRVYGVEEFNGACAFTYRGAIEFGIEVSADESHILLHSVIGKLSTGDEAEQLQKLMMRNYLGLETQGATLALDGTGENVCLWISLSLTDLDTERFENSLGAFLDLSEAHCSLLQEQNEPVRLL